MKVAARRIAREGLWTEVSTPERTRKVPSSDSEKVRIARNSVQIFRASRFSITAACNGAAPCRRARA